MATIFARAIACERNLTEPRLTFCGECYACRTIASGDYELWLTEAGNPANVLLSTTTFPLAAGVTSTFVVVPEYVATHWWERLLYNQSAKRLRSMLLGRPHTVIVNVPYRRDTTDT